MINISDARDSLTKIIESAVPTEVTVYKTAPDGTITVPAAVIGMPAWDEEPATTYCFPRWTWPISVVVARPGIDDAGTISQLDELWPAVFYALRDASQADPSLGGICAQSVINRAQFGMYELLSAKPWPAQLIFLSLYG